MSPIQTIIVSFYSGLPSEKFEIYSEAVGASSKMTLNYLSKVIG